MPSIPSIALTACVLLAPSSAPTSTAAKPAQSCPGCVGSGGSATASGGSCGGLITITVNVQNGRCKVLSGEEVGDIACRQLNECLPTVTRVWSGLPANTPLDFCVEIGGQNLCLDPKPSSGSGTSQDERDSASMDCSNEPENTRSYSFGSPACGLLASVEARCSACGF